MYNDFYYRIYFLKDKNKITVVCMQDFDEDDYDVDRFLKDDWDDRLQFFDEREAINWLNEHVKREYIDEQYLNPQEEEEEDEEEEVFDQADYLK